MRFLLLIGAILLLLGLASLFVPVPSRQRHGVDVGGVSLGVETTSREKLHPGISAVLIAAGVILIIADQRGRR
jgi:L-aminopeptidase/D-esterase-like protein